MPYKLGSKDQWMHHEVFNTVHHAVSNASGTVLYVYGPKGKLIFAQDVRDLILEHLNVNYPLLDNSTYSDETLVSILVEAYTNIMPLVRKLKNVIRNHAR
jgi:hypothetical protein